MKTFSLSTPSPVEAAISHILHTNPSHVILDVGHLPTKPLEPALNATCLSVGGQVANALAEAGINFDTQFLVENPLTAAKDISQQQVCAQMDGRIDLGQPILETTMHQAAQKVIEVLFQMGKTTTTEVSDADLVFLTEMKPEFHGRGDTTGLLIPKNSALLSKDGIPTGATVDTALVQKNNEPGTAFVTVLPDFLVDQQKNLARILKALGIKANYTAIFCGQ